MTRKKKRNRPEGTYLDTSIFLSAYFGHSLQQDSINSATANTRRVTSAYVFTEIKNQCRILIDLYFLVLSEDTVEDALAVFENSFAARLPKYALMATRKALRDLTGANTKVKALAAVADVIFGYIEYSEFLVSETLDGGVECPLSYVEFSREPGLSTADRFRRFYDQVHCVASDPKRCTQGEFIEKSQRFVDLITNDAAVTRHDGGRNAQEAFKKITNGAWTHLRGLRQRCSKIGDVLIALQCPKEATLITTDAVYEEYVRILGRKSKILPSLASLRAQRDALVE